MDNTAQSDSLGKTEDPQRLMRAATRAAVIAAGTMVTIKAIAWWLTGSVALLGSMLDSILDVAASLINMVAVHHALTPKDKEHRFGHGKAEALAGLGQALFILLSGLFLIKESLDRFITPATIENSGIGIGVTVICIVITLALVRFQQYVIARSGSLAISADALHYKGDLFMNVAVLFAIGLSGFANMPLVDPLIGLAIAAYILFSAWQIVAQSLDQLMDKEFPNEKRDKVISVAKSHEKVLGVHDVRTRSAGTSDFIQLHIELDPQMTLVEAHDIADEVEYQLKQAFPRAEVIIHQDPAGHEELSALEMH